MRKNKIIFIFMMLLLFGQVVLAENQNDFGIDVLLKDEKGNVIKNVEVYLMQFYAVEPLDQALTDKEGKAFLKKPHQSGTYYFYALFHSNQLPTNRMGSLRDARALFLSEEQSINTEKKNSFEFVIDSHKFVLLARQANILNNIFLQAGVFADNNFKLMSLKRISSAPFIQLFVPMNKYYTVLATENNSIRDNSAYVSSFVAQPFMILGLF